MPRALITGICGQDGPYLARHLLSLGYEVYGSYRREATARWDNLEYLEIKNDIELVPMDITEYESVRRVIEDNEFDEIYNLAGQSHVGLSFKIPMATLLATGAGLVNILEAVRSVHRDAKVPRIYQASTSELFGGTQGKENIFDENSGFHPLSPYACAKLYAYSMAVNYREAYSMHISNGILFNHESPLRGDNFVTRKITKFVGQYTTQKRAALKTPILRLGNVDASRDWGHAEDFVKAMHLIIRAQYPDDYVVATGVNHTVREFVTEAFMAVGDLGVWSGEGLDAKFHIDGELVAEIDPQFYRPSDCNDLTGNPDKIRNKLGWTRKNTFFDMVSDMVRRDLNDAYIINDEQCCN